MPHHDGTGSLGRLFGAGFMLEGGAQLFQDGLVAASTQGVRSAGVVSPLLPTPGADAERGAEMVEDLLVPLHLAHHLPNGTGGIARHDGLKNLLQAVESPPGVAASFGPSRARLAEHLLNLENALIQIQVVAAKR